MLDDDNCCSDCSNADEEKGKQERENRYLKWRVQRVQKHVVSLDS
jgi:hypothetical protein